MQQFNTETIHRSKSPPDLGRFRKLQPVTGSDSRYRKRKWWLNWLQTNWLNGYRAQSNYPELSLVKPILFWYAESNRQDQIRALPHLLVSREQRAFYISRVLNI